MNQKRSDLRILRTKKAIYGAFIEILGEKGLEAITIKDITTKANINRATFYHHFQDKYDLLEQCEQSIIEKINQIMFESDILEWDHPRAVKQYHQVLTKLLKYIHSQAPFLQALLGPKGDLSFQEKIKTILAESLFKNKKVIENHSVPSQYLISYLASAHLGIIQQWLQGEGKETPEKIAKIFSTLTIHGPLYQKARRE